MPRLRAAARRRPATADQARRCDSVRVRRQQGAQAGAGRGAGAGRRRRHADHRRRRAVEPRARDRAPRPRSSACARCSSRTARRRESRPPTRCSIGCSAPRSSTSPSREERAPAMVRDRRAAARARGGDRSRFRSARRRRSARSATCSRSPSCVEQMPAPDVIVHSTSSGGTQAGLVAGCRLLGLRTRVVGISADDPAASLQAQVARASSAASPNCSIWIAARLLATARRSRSTIASSATATAFRPTASREAIELAARTEAMFLDPTYTAKAMAALIAYVRQQRVRRGPDDPVLAHRRAGRPVPVASSWQVG